MTIVTATVSPPFVKFYRDTRIQQSSSWSTPQKNPGHAPRNLVQRRRRVKSAHAIRTCLAPFPTINGRKRARQATPHTASAHPRLRSAPRVLVRVSNRLEAAAGRFPQSLWRFLSTQRTERDEKSCMLSEQAAADYRRAIGRDACSKAAPLERRMRGPL